QQAWHMTVTFVDPGKLMRMTGGLGPLQGMGLDGALEWRFVAENGGTRITLWYRAGGYTPDDLTKFVPVVDKVQGLQLGGLAEYLRKLKPAAKP
ncbi:MAG TPA: SRPBCC domain-containing protein, partial [Pseudoxanthomonas sp.]|nr:SRPBCC domain-containing protein [Pseudoxanthomonas sp.]